MPGLRMSAISSLLKSCISGGDGKVGFSERTGSGGSARQNGGGVGLKLAPLQISVGKMDRRRAGFVSGWGGGLNRRRRRVGCGRVPVVVAAVDWEPGRRGEGGGYFLPREEETANESRGMEVLSDWKAKRYRPKVGEARALVARVAKEGPVKEVMSVMRFVESRGIELDERIYLSLLRCYVNRGDLRGAARALWNMQEAEVPRIAEHYNFVIASLAKVGNVEDMMRVLRMMINDGYKPDTYTYTVLIAGYGKTRQSDKAEQLFEEMQREKSLKPSIVTWGALLDAYAQSGELEKAFSVFERMEAEGVKPNHAIFGALIEARIKAGDVEGALGELDRMRERDLEPDAVTYSALIEGFCLRSSLTEALRVFQDMVESGIEPTADTYLPILGMYAKEGNVGKAESLMEDVMLRGIEVGKPMYERLVDAYVNSGDTGGAVSVIEEMQSRDMPPNPETYRTVIDRYNQEFISKTIGVDPDAQKIDVSFMDDESLEVDFNPKEPKFTPPLITDTFNIEDSETIIAADLNWANNLMSNLFEPLDVFPPEAVPEPLEWWEKDIILDEEQLAKFQEGDQHIDVNAEDQLAFALEERSNEPGFMQGVQADDLATEMFDPVGREEDDSEFAEDDDELADILEFEDDMEDDDDEEDSVVVGSVKVHDDEDVDSFWIDDDEEEAEKKVEMDDEVEGPAANAPDWEDQDESAEDEDEEEGVEVSEWLGTLSKAAVHDEEDDEFSILRERDEDDEEISENRSKKGTAGAKLSTDDEDDDDEFKLLSESEEDNNESELSEAENNESELSEADFVKMMSRTSKGAAEGPRLPWEEDDDDEEEDDDLIVNYDEEDDDEDDDEDEDDDFEDLDLNFANIFGRDGQSGEMEEDVDDDELDEDEDEDEEDEFELANFFREKRLEDDSGTDDGPQDGIRADRNLKSTHDAEDEEVQPTKTQVSTTGRGFGKPVAEPKGVKQVSQDSIEAFIREERNDDTLSDDDFEAMLQSGIVEELKESKAAPDAESETDAKEIDDLDAEFMRALGLADDEVGLGNVVEDSATEEREESPFKSVKGKSLERSAKKNSEPAEDSLMGVDTLDNVLEELDSRNWDKDNQKVANRPVQDMMDSYNEYEENDEDISDDELMEILRLSPEEIEKEILSEIEQTEQSTESGKMPKKTPRSDFKATPDVKPFNVERTESLFNFARNDEELRGKGIPQFEKEMSLHDETERKLIEDFAADFGWDDEKPDSLDEFIASMNTSKSTSDEKEDGKEEPEGEEQERSEKKKASAE